MMVPKSSMIVTCGPRPNLFLAKILLYARIGTDENLSGVWAVVHRQRHKGGSAAGHQRQSGSEKMDGGNDIPPHNVVG
jgi:hypothetical protein